MIISPAREKALVAVVLSVFLFLVLVFGTGSYTAALGSDPFGIVYFAGHLARGDFYSDIPVYDWLRPDWGPDESHFVLGGNYIKSGPRIYNKYTIGFPLLLACSIRVLGDYSVYYFNLIVLIALLLLVFRMSDLFLRDQPRGRLLALCAPLIFLVMVDPAWQLALRPSHDLAGIMFIFAGAVLAFRGLGDSRRIRIPALLAGAFAFGCAGTLRLPNVLAAVPAGIYFLVRTVGRVRWWKIAISALLAIGFFAIALSPALLQNQLTGGHPLRPPRPEIVSGERTVLGGMDQESPPPLWIGFFPTTFPDVVRYFWRLWGPFFTFLLWLGMIALWRRPETKWLLLGIPLILILLYSMWVHLMTRYMLVAHPFLIILMVAGAGRLLGHRPRWWSALGVALVVILDFLVRSRMQCVHRLEHLDTVVLIAGVILWLLFVGGRKLAPGGWSAALLAAAFFGLFIARYAPPWLRRSPGFQLAEAKRFGGDIDSLVPPGSVIFSTKPVFQHINLFSSSYSLRPFEMERIGTDSREGFERLRQRGTGLYVLDNRSYKRDSGKSLPLFRAYYDVTPVGQLPAGRYNLEAHFGQPVCTLYRIEPWSARELKLNFDLPEDTPDLLLAFNLRKIHGDGQPPRRLAVELDGRPLSGPFHEGMNFFRLRGAGPSGGGATLVIRSDRPLPRDIDLRLADLAAPYQVDLAEELSFPDRDAMDIFTEERLRDADLVRLGWDQTGSVAIPTVLLPETVLIGELEVRSAQDLKVAVNLRVALNGEEIARFPVGPGVRREPFRFRLPERLISSSRSELEFTADRPPGRSLSLAEEYRGALLFESITIRRRFESFPVPLEPGEGGVVALEFGPVSEDDCPGPYRILLDGEEAAAAVGRRGVHRLLIEPGSVSSPAPRLGAVGADGLCRLLFIRPPLVWKASNRFRVDIGGRDDWAFLEGGFFPPERYQGRLPVRWTGREARISLPLWPREARLTVKTIGARPPATFLSAPRVSARLDGQELGDHLLQEGDARYSWSLPVEPSGPRVADLVLRVDPWRPSDFLPVGDSRELGLMLEAIELEYREAEK